MIKIEQILPLLREGWVCWSTSGCWWWFPKEYKPSYDNEGYIIFDEGTEPRFIDWNWSDASTDYDCFKHDVFKEIAPFDGKNLNDSIMECGR